MAAPQGRAIRTLYRLFLRQSQQLEREAIQLLEARMPMDKAAWLQNGGAHGWATAWPDYSKDALQRLLPWLDLPDHPGVFSPSELRAVVQQVFRRPVPAGGEMAVLDRAFDALRMLGEQLHMARCSSSAVTNGVRVDVTTAFIGRQNELDATYDEEHGIPPKYYFTYRIRVTNVGEETVQLRTRHFVIRNDAGETVAEVARGARGVVGCTPILKPGSCFQYYSGTDMDGPGGAMEGSYGMAVLDSKSMPTSVFDASIARFPFTAPTS